MVGPHVVGVRQPEIAIEAVARRQESRIVAQVPFAKDGRGIAAGLQNLRQQHFVFVDSDFGAYYAAANSPANSGAGVGYGSGTNVKGHVFKFAYSLSDSMTLSIKWLMTDLITRYPGGSESGMNRMQLDAVWKF